MFGSLWFLWPFHVYRFPRNRKLLHKRVSFAHKKTPTVRRFGQLQESSWEVADLFYWWLRSHLVLSVINPFQKLVDCFVRYFTLLILPVFQPVSDVYF